MKMRITIWDSQLKENGVFSQRFARPFESG